MANYKIEDGVLKEFWTDPTETEAVFPEGIRAVGAYVLKNHERIRRVVIPEGVEEICDRAFDCYDVFHIVTSLQEVVFPRSLKRIGEFAFFCCKKLRRVSLPPFLTELGDKAFSETGLMNVRLPNSLKTIGQAVFAACEDFLWAVLPEKIEEIPGGLFWGCTSLQGVELPETVRVIGGISFQNCQRMEKITLPAHLERIEMMAFANCRRLTALHIPASVEDYSLDIVDGCDRLSSLTVDPDSHALIQKGDVLIGYFSDEDGNLTEDAFAAFRTDYTAAECVIPDGVIVIYEPLFRMNKKLRKVVLPPSLKYLRGRVFQGCDSLQNVVLPDEIEVLPEFAFDRCRSLKSIHLPANLKNIGRKSLQGTSLGDLVIPAGVTEVGADAFKDAFVRTVEIQGDPKSLPLKKAKLNLEQYPLRADRMPLEQFPKSRMDWALKDRIARMDTLCAEAREDTLAYLQKRRRKLWEGPDDRVRTLILSEKLFTAADVEWALGSSGTTGQFRSALEEYRKSLPADGGSGQAEERAGKRSAPTKLTTAQMRKMWPTMKLSDGSEIITDYRGTDPEPVIPAKLGRGRVVEIGKDALNPKAKTAAERESSCYEDITYLELSEGIQQIGSRAFANLPMLEEVVLPDSLVGISDHAFSGCVSLKKIIIPPNVGRVYNLALDGCIRLQRIVVRGKKTKLSRLWNQNSQSNCVLEAPDTAAFRKCAAEYGMQFEPLNE